MVENGIVIRVVLIILKEGFVRYQKCFFWKFEREHNGLCDRTNFQKDTSESVQITFQNSRTQKTEFLEPPLNNKYLTLRLGSELLEMTNCCEDPQRMSVLNVVLK